MKCFTCPNDITDPIKQFGDVKHPICQSCYLTGVEDFLVQVPYVVYLLEGGYDITTAVQADEEKWREENAEAFEDDLIGAPSEDEDEDA